MKYPLVKKERAEYYVSYRILTFFDCFSELLMPEPYITFKSLINPRQRHALGLFLLTFVLKIDRVKLTASKLNFPLESV